MSRKIVTYVGKYKLPKYSVLMSVYDKELPENLNESLESMLLQSYPPSDFVMVCDGKLTSELNIILKSFESEYKGTFRVIRCDEKIGAGIAFNIGIKACKYNYIVKMDSDDISYSHRCLKEMTLFAVNPKLDIVGSYVEEFNSDIKKITAIKKVPVTQEEIWEYGRRRNPFNRQTVAFKRESALNIGGYSNLKLCEDYEFCMRMLANGGRGQNIPEVLVRYRVHNDTPVVRKSWRLTKGFIKVRWTLLREKIIGFTDFFMPCALQMGLFIFPQKFTRWVYNKFLRG